MSLYWIFLIPAIIIALFSEKIDARAKVDNNLKICLVVICILMAITSIILIAKL